MTIPEFTINGGASAFGTTKETLKRALVLAGEYVDEDRHTYPIKTIHRVLAGDVKAERARLLSEQADSAALQNKKDRGELVSVSEMERQLWQKIYLPMKIELEQMPEKLAQLLSLDESGKATILDWLEDFKSKCREPQPKETSER